MYRAPEPKLEKRQDGLEECPKCNAIYNNDGNWIEGYYRSTTGTETPTFVGVNRIEKDVCPICKTPTEEHQLNMSTCTSTTY